MQRGCLVQSCGKADLVQTIEEVLDADAALVAAIPLIEDAMKVGARGILATESTPDVHNMLLVDGFFKSEGLVCGLLLAAQYVSFESLSWANDDAFGKTAYLVGIGSLISLASIVGKLGSSLSVVASEDLVGPLGILKLLSLPVGDEDWGLGSLALSVIEFDCSLVLGVIDLQAHLFETVLVHGAGVCEFETGVVPVDSLLVSLGAEVDIGQAALVRPLLSYVHFTFLFVFLYL